MKLVDSKKITSAKKRSEVAFEIVEKLRGGSILIAPIEQGYVLAADLYSEEGIRIIKSLKELGEDVYFPLLVADIDQLAPLTGPITPEQRLLALEFWPGPLLLQSRALAESMLTMGSKYVPESLYFRCSSNKILSEVCELMGPLVYTPILVENSIVTAVNKIEKKVKTAASHLIVGKSFKPNQIPTILSFEKRSPVLVREGALEESRIRKILPNLQLN